MNGIMKLLLILVCLFAVLGSLHQAASLIEHSDLFSVENQRTHIVSSPARHAEADDSADEVESNKIQEYYHKFTDWWKNTFTAVKEWAGRHINGSDDDSEEEIDPTEYFDESEESVEEPTESLEERREMKEKLQEAVAEVERLSKIIGDRFNIAEIKTFYDESDMD